MAKVTFKGVKFEIEGIKDVCKTQNKESDFEMGKLSFGIEEYSVEGNLEEVTKLMYEFGKHVIDQIPFKELIADKKENTVCRFNESKARIIEAENRTKELDIENKKLDK